jgi:hypothetical protein
MVWVTRENAAKRDELKAFDAQTHSDLKALLMAALAGGVLAFVVAAL